MISSRKLAQGLILAVALGLSAVLVFAIWKGKMQKEHQAVVLDDNSEGEMKLTDMEYTEMQDGRKFWTLRASEAKYFQDQQKTLLTAVQLTFFLQDGDEIHLESQDGALYAGSKNIELWNSVHADLPQGYQLYTDRALYEAAKKSISSETAVRLTGSDIQLQGSHWEYRIPERRALLEKGIEASVRLFSPKKSPGK